MHMRRARLLDASPEQRRAKRRARKAREDGGKGVARSDCSAAKWLMDLLHRCIHVVAAVVGACAVCLAGLFNLPHSR
jgi:hypothetical protein